MIVEEDGVRDSDSTLRQKLARCKLLGFETVALSVIIDVKNNSPIVPPPPDLKTLLSDQMKVYTRLTVRVSDTIQLYKLNKCKETSKYNLIALEPQNSKLLQYICMGSADLDILTINLSERLDNLSKVKFNILDERGVCTEINYGPAQSSSSLRRNIICNGQNLTEKSVKNLILSSGVSDSFRLRGPKDAKNLGVLFLLPIDKCHNAVFNNGSKALKLSQHRTNPASSAIELVKTE